MGLITDKFTKIGGAFLLPEEEIAKKLSKITVFIFDWDGVFNDGFKDSEGRSGFSEADSMGVNMLRFNQWRIQGKAPLVFIISGENNLSAIQFAKREHFNAIYLGYSDKRKALNHIAETYGVSFDEMAFVFDDILDVAVTNLCKLSFCIRRDSSPLFKNYIVDQKKCCYISGNEGGQHAVREVTELIIGFSGQYDETITKRIEYGGEYTTYIAERNLVNTVVESRAK